MRCIQGFFSLFLFLFVQSGVGHAVMTEPDWSNSAVSLTEYENDGSKPGYLRQEEFSVQPGLGVLNFENGSELGTRRERVLWGLLFDLNSMRFFDRDLKLVYFGPSLGILFSRLGDAAGNCFIFPTNLKAGIHFGDRFRLSVHGGGNVVFRSVASSMNLDLQERGADSLWKYYPNAGMDFEFGLGRNAVFRVRPDWTFATADTVFMGSASLGLFF